MSKGAFSQARQKLKYQAFVELDKVQINHFYDHMEVEKWKGFRLIGIDGSTSRLPNSQSIIEQYGIAAISETGTPIILSRLSQAYDLLNHITIDTQYSQYSNNEHDMALKHLDFIKQGDLVLYDRNYGSFWLFALLQSKGIDFCARLKVGSWKLAKELAESNENELIAEIYPSKESAKKCRLFGLTYKSLRLRFVCIELSTGEKEVLVTSLMDQQEISSHELSELYQKRWFVEEAFKRMKSRLEIENYSGKSPLSLLQDYYAKIFSCNLTSILMSETQVQVDQISKNRKHNYQINFTQALSRMKNSIILLFVRPQRKIKIYLSHLKSLFIDNIEPVIPDRHYRRNFRKSVNIYPASYKNAF